MTDIERIIDDETERRREREREREREKKKKNKNKKKYVFIKIERREYQLPLGEVSSIFQLLWKKTFFNKFDVFFFIIENTLFFLTKL